MNNVYANLSKYALKQETTCKAMKSAYTKEYFNKRNGMSKLTFYSKK